MYGNCVYIGNSSICDGLGIFSKKNIKKGEIITWYYGIIDKNKTTDNYKYTMEYNTFDEKVNLIGISDPNKITYGKGMAQFANDAICFELTGKNNNSYFFQKGRYVFLIASKNIKKNQEILASYGINYWINEIKKKSKEYNNNFKQIINILFFIINIVEKYCKCNIYEYKGLNEHNKIYFDLLINKRWCPYSNILHYDNNFYIMLKKEKNNDVKIYYICITCKLKDLGLLIKVCKNGFVNAIK